MDGGTRSREETRLRLLLHDAGIPRPRTDILLFDGSDTATLGMGWDAQRVGISVLTEAAGPRQGFRHHEVVQRLGWLELGVVALNQRRSIVHRVRDALRRRAPR